MVSASVISFLQRGSAVLVDPVDLSVAVGKHFAQYDGQGRYREDDEDLLHGSPGSRVVDGTQETVDHGVVGGGSFLLQLV
jgi:hypothetical protein